MRIGIVGAPGAGKTKFAKELAVYADGKYTIIDNYAQRLQKSTGLALGFWGSYTDNFMVQGVRAAEEHKVLHKQSDISDDVITVGTVMDTVLYCAMHNDPAWGKIEHKLMANYVAEVAMRSLGLWFSNTWNYQLTFFLPYSEVLRRKKQGTPELEFNDMMAEALESYGVPYYQLKAGPDRAKVAIEVVNIAKEEEAKLIAQEAGTSAPEQPGN